MSQSIKWELETNTLNLPIHVTLDEKGFETRLYDGGIAGELLRPINNYVQFTLPVIIYFLLIIPFIPVTILLEEFINELDLNTVLSYIVRILVIGIYLEYLPKPTKKIKNRIENYWLGFYKKRVLFTNEPVITKFSNNINKPVRKTRTRKFPLQSLKSVELSPINRKTIYFNTIYGDRIALNGSYGIFEDMTKIKSIQSELEHVINEEPFETIENDEETIHERNQQVMTNFDIRVLTLIIYTSFTFTFFIIHSIIATNTPFFTNYTILPFYIGYYPIIFSAFIILSVSVVFVLLIIRYL